MTVQVVLKGNNQKAILVCFKHEHLCVYLSLRFMVFPACQTNNRTTLSRPDFKKLQRFSLLTSVKLRREFYSIPSTRIFSISTMCCCVILNNRKHLQPASAPKGDSSVKIQYKKASGSQEQRANKTWEAIRTPSPSCPSLYSEGLALLRPWTEVYIFTSTQTDL